MNESQLKMIFRIIKPFLTPDKIRAAANGLIKWIQNKKALVTIDPEAGEIEVTAIFYEADEKQYFAVAILDSENKIIRFESVQEISEIIEILISNL
jgi:t-SNARE complex subunit (syntaxin)